MKADSHRYSKLKHKLMHKKQEGCRFAEWSLKPEEVDYIEGVLGFQTIPLIFRITTKPISGNVRQKSGLLKEIHFSKMNKKTHMFKKLSRKDQKLLKEYGIYYTPIKYKIVLIST